jgi:iron complex outermembrane receptor protein
VKVFEIGTKATVLDGRLRFGAATFTGDYKGIHVRTIEPDGYAPVTNNAGDARIRGGELEFDAAVGSLVRVIGGIAYLDGQYTRIAPNVPDITLNSRLTDSPEWSGNLSLIGSVPLQRHSVSGRIDWSYRSSHFNDAENTPELWQDDFSVLNASATWRCATCSGQVWSATVGVNNLADELYLITGNQLAVQGPIAASYARPREWFLTVAVEL